MTELYRFRTTERLLKECADCEELERQTIYFANSQELNDPMEGFRDIFWKGDHIVWANFFRHYLYCLHMTCVIVRFLGDSQRIGPQLIPVMSDQDQDPAPRLRGLIEDIYGRVFDKAKLHKFIEKLVNAERIVRHDEILFYLQGLHHLALREIQDTYVDYELESSNEIWSKFPDSFEHFHKILDLLPQFEEEGFVDYMMRIGSSTWQDIHLKYKYLRRENPGSNLESNLTFLIFDFPKSYLQQLERVLYPSWYAACFTRDYGNASMWANYGDGHKGVCLIFESDTQDGVNSLTLNKVTGYSNHGKTWGPRRMEFHDVKYGEKAGEIDFFRSLGMFPEIKLIEIWYSDEDGNLSECASHFGIDTEAWRQAYWDRFYPALSIKTLDWKYEKETRLVLHGLSGDLDKNSRALTYDFSLLKGIIFGIRTPDSEKLKIIEIISKKCDENHRSDFELFQAYYCHDTGRIQTYGLVGLTIGN